MALLTLEDWHALPEDNTHVYELVDGVVHAGLKPGPHHQVASANLTVAINRQLPGNLAAVPQSEVVIKPGFLTTGSSTSRNRLRSSPMTLSMSATRWPSRRR